MNGNQELVRFLAWLLITAPIFGGASALVARELGRRQWLWFVLGALLNGAAVMTLMLMWVWRDLVASLRSR